MPSDSGRRTGLVTYGFNSPIDVTEWIEAHRPKQLNPVQQLMWAVLDDAIEEANWKERGTYKYTTHNSSKAKHEREMKAARAWIENVDPYWIFSFESVCEHLGLSASAARKVIVAGYRKAA